jgi:small subunit ribosomal protein S15
MISAQETKNMINKFGKNDKDTGSTAVQVALLTTRINNLTPHFGANKLDTHSGRGLMKLIGQRKSLLRYLSKRSPDEYGKVIQSLGIRK